MVAPHRLGKEPGNAMSRRHKPNKLSGQFVAHSVEMIESPAWRALSDNGRRLLERIELEHAHHGGAENGRLKVTYDQFTKYGIRRHAISAAIREAVSLGFLQVTRQGGYSTLGHAWPSYYRLTYAVGRGERGIPTDEWRGIKQKRAEGVKQ